MKGIVKVAELGGYATCSWDKTLRFWRSHVRPEEVRQQHARLLKVPDPLATNRGGAEMSAFERANPRFMPPSLLVRGRLLLPLRRVL